MKDFEMRDYPAVSRWVQYNHKDPSKKNTQRVKDRKKQYVARSREWDDVLSR
jgi:hypothetical protein